MSASEAAAASADRVTISLAPGPAIGPVLGRVVWMVAASRDAPIDRLDELVLVADAVAMRAPAHLAGDRLDVTLEAEQERLRLRAGPMTTGSGDRVLADDQLPAIGSVIDRLTDEARVEVSPEGGEYLSLLLSL